VRGIEHFPKCWKICDEFWYSEYQSKQTTYKYRCGRMLLMRREVAKEGMTCCVVVLKTAEGVLQVCDVLCCHSAADCSGCTTVRWRTVLSWCCRLQWVYFSSVTYSVVMVLQTAVNALQFCDVQCCHSAVDCSWCTSVLWLQCCYGAADCSGCAKGLWRTASS